MVKGFTHESVFIESKEWYTPPRIFDALGIEFDLDPASPGKHIVSWIPAERHLTIAEDGLNSKWEGRVWLNPPYGRLDTPTWLAKLVKHRDGIALVFSRTDTEWFHKYVPQADAICFVRGRISFIKATGVIGHNPGAGSMLLAFGEHCVEAVRTSQLGWFVNNREAVKKWLSKTT